MPKFHIAFLASIHSLTFLPRFSLLLSEKASVYTASPLLSLYTAIHIRYTFFITLYEKTLPQADAFN